jgi:RNA polymerase sigma factor for flagellar operon FliA
MQATDEAPRPTKRIVLAERWEAYRGSGDTRARDDLILAYSPIVKYVASRIAARMPAHVDWTDLMSDGFRGLMEAVERFDPDRGVGFEFYAEQRIRGAIFDGLRSLDWVPRAVRAEAREIEHASAELAMRLRRVPTDAELAAKLSMSGAELRASLQRISDSRIVALDEPWGPTPSDHASLTRLETLPGPSADDPASGIDVSEQRERIAGAVRRLPEREQAILGLHYQQELNFTEIGEILGLSGSRICQLHAKAALQLRMLLRTATGGPGGGSASPSTG